jgi:hypothetical protein
VHGVPTDPLSNVYARRTLPLSIPTPDPLRPDPFRSFPRRNSTRRRYWYPSRSPALLCRPLLGFAPDPSPRSNSSPRCRREEQLGEEDSQYQRLGEGACSRPSMCMCSSPVGQEANLISLSPSLSLSLSLSLSIQMVGFNAQGCHRTAACPPTRRGGASGGRDGERSHRAKQLRSSGRAAPRPAPGGSGGDRRRGAEQATNLYASTPNASTYWYLYMYSSYSFFYEAGLLYMSCLLFLRMHELWPSPNYE